MESKTPPFAVDLVGLSNVLEKKIVIPNYQRPYKWKPHNVERLLMDINDSISKKQKKYRLGTVILHEEGQDFNIVDGQQRLISLTLILLFLGDETSPLLHEKVRFSHIDSKYNIQQNYEAIRKWFVSNKNVDQAAFKTYLLYDCELVIIVLKDISEAFQLFDSQNSRGKSLEPYDLLKAFHLREMKDDTENHQRKCAVNWQVAVDKKQLDNLGKYIYRIRKWARGEPAGIFTKENIDEFKGVNRYNDSDLTYVTPYLSQNNDAHFQLTQPIINGKCFFDFVHHYNALFEQLFVKPETGSRGVNMEGFDTFYQSYCLYIGSSRDGDTYVREMFECTVMLFVDKFGYKRLDEEIYKALYKWCYIVRIKLFRVLYTSIDAYMRNENTLRLICSSYYPKDLLSKVHGITPAEYPINRSIEEIQEILEYVRPTDINN